MNLGDFEVSIAVVAFAVTTAAVYVKSRFDRIDRLLMTSADRQPCVDVYEARLTEREAEVTSEVAKMNALIAREAARDREIATVRSLLERMMNAKPYR